MFTPDSCQDSPFRASPRPQGEAMIYNGCYRERMKLNPFFLTPKNDFFYSDIFGTRWGEGSFLCASQFMALGT